MQMHDVLKKLAELDSAEPRLENELKTVDSLMTVSNVSEAYRYDDDDDWGDDDWNDRDDDLEFAEPGSGSALRAASDSNPRNRPCPTCNHPNRLTPADERQGYQCNRCADATERGGEIDYYEGPRGIDEVAEMVTLAGTKVSECGMMGMAPATMPPHTPASISVTANSGNEVSDILRSLMNIASMDHDESPVNQHHEIELGLPHVAKPVGDMAGVLSMVDRMDGPADEVDIVGDEGENELDSDEYKAAEDLLGGAVGAVGGAMLGGPVGAVRGYSVGSKVGDILAGDKDEKDEGMYANSPEPEIEPHDYGDKQVKPKQQGLKQRLGDNPYAPTHEAVDLFAMRLMQDYKEFVSESNKSK